MPPREIRTTQLTVADEGQETFAPGVYRVSIDDEAGGEFVLVESETPEGTEKISIDPKDWPTLRRAIGRMIRGCRP